MTTFNDDNPSAESCGVQINHWLQEFFKLSLTPNTQLQLVWTSQLSVLKVIRHINKIFKRKTERKFQTSVHIIKQ
ncbi:unnamed protein product [Leptidea sinapis]|uniref:Uncharacterized protein n=1 Tax=Leptidea sinapis TaxID=189913 RepID=A0A5E4QJ25_9NEOP|nr:unnamed protein product [Leptidea sinapis]